MYKNQEIWNTFTEEHQTEYLRQAQRAEMVEIVKELALSPRPKIKVLDIGIGEGRVPLILSGLKEIWDKIVVYRGIENSEMCIAACQKMISSQGLEDKVKLVKMDVQNLEQMPPDDYDFVLCTYFTTGNFWPEGFSFETREGKLAQDYEKLLVKNKKFQQIFRGAYHRLSSGGKIIIGSTYIDNETTRSKQREFYEKCGMSVITEDKNSFMTTKEGFWSQRFTEQRFYDYFDWVKKKQIEFRNLDPYQFARMVLVTK